MLTYVPGRQDRHPFRKWQCALGRHQEQGRVPQLQFSRENIAKEI